GLESDGERIERDRAGRIGGREPRDDLLQLIVRRRVWLVALARGRMRGARRRYLVCGRGGAAATPPAPPATAPPARPLARALPRGGTGACRTIRDARERDAEPRRCVPDRVEGPVVRHDLDPIAGTRAAEPHAGVHRDPEIAPIGHARRGRAMHEVRTPL